ncbi:MAG: hypothetical protein JWQ33_1345 [Ramlibacter sp.]|nr:hypothetical protein [Ramlibacter sp.]
MTTFLLLRHASHDWLARGLAGRLPGVSLNAQGRAEADALPGQLEKVRIDAIYSSPQPRTRQTAAPLAARRGLAVRIEPALDEVDLGQWMGMTFDQVSAEPLWEAWVQRRSTVTPPGGEPFRAVQERALAAVERLRDQHADQSVLLVSHGDVIKSVLAFHLGISLDGLEGFDIAPASLSVIDLGDGWSKVRLLNGLAGLPQG